MAGEIILETPKPEKITSPLPNPERIGSPEASISKSVERPAQASEIVKPGESAPVQARPAAPAVLSYEQQRAQAIDAVLSDGLSEIYLKMDPKSQQSFRVSGEETVKKINTMLSKTKVQASKIIDLIRAWLKLIPGVNRFFLEQETKIKADKIMRLKDTL